MLEFSSPSVKINACICSNFSLTIKMVKNLGATRESSLAYISEQTQTVEFLQLERDISTGN